MLPNHGEMKPLMIQISFPVISGKANSLKIIYAKRDLAALPLPILSSQTDMGCIIW